MTMGYCEYTARAMLHEALTTRRIHLETGARAVSIYMIDSIELLRWIQDALPHAVSDDGLVREDVWDTCVCLPLADAAALRSSRR